MAFNEKAWHVGFKWTIGNEDVPAGAIALDNTSKQLHICDIADVGKDWNVGVVVDPTVYIHCYDTNAATDYIKIWHDDTDANIDCYGATALNLGIGGTNYLEMTTSALAPTTTNVMALGTTLLNFTDIYLDSGGVINFDGGDVTITHSANALAFAGATSGYSFDDTVTCTDTTAGFVASGAATDGISITGACTDGIHISGGCTSYALNISTIAEAGIYYVANYAANSDTYVHGMKIECTRASDIIVGSSGVWGAQIVVNQGTGYTAKMAPSVYGLQIAIKGDSVHADTNTYPLLVETQSNGKAHTMLIVRVNDGGTTTSGDVVNFASYENCTNILELGMPDTTTATSGIYFTDNVGTGTLTSLIGFDARNSTNLFKCAYAAGCITVTSSGGATRSHKVAFDVEGTTYYLSLYTD